MLSGKIRPAAAPTVFKMSANIGVIERVPGRLLAHGQGVLSGELHGFRVSLERVSGPAMLSDQSDNIFAKSDVGNTSAYLLAISKRLTACDTWPRSYTASSATATR
jgi:hypothetical protein